MSLKYVFILLMLPAALFFAGCATTSGQTAAEQTKGAEPAVGDGSGTSEDFSALEPKPSKQVEEYYLKPASGEDAAKIDTVEKEVIECRKIKDAAVKDKYVVDYEISVARKNLAYEKDRETLLKAEYELAAAKNDQAEINRVDLEKQKHQTELEKRECIIEYLIQKKDHGQTTVNLRDAQLATKVAERNYLMAKVARENQDKLLGPPERCNEDEEARIDVSEYERAWKRKITEEKMAQNIWNESESSLKTAETSCETQKSGTSE